MSKLIKQTAENLTRIRANKPLVHNITNFVVMNYTANVLLATGASPVMAHAQKEVEEMGVFATPAMTDTAPSLSLKGLRAIRQDVDLPLVALVA